MKNSYLLFFLIGIVNQVSGQIGTPDPSFGKSGFQTTSVSINLLSEQALKVLPAASGYYVVSQVNNGVLAAKYSGNGSLDSTYGTNGYSVAVNGVGVDVALQSDGKLVVAGASFIARYTKNGALDNTFGQQGIQTVNSTISLKAILTQADKIVVAGNLSVRNSSNIDFAVLRYNSDGSPDTSFSEDGIQTTDFTQNSRDFLQAIALQGDKIVAVGYTGLNIAIARYNADGSLDTSFSQDGKLTDSKPDFGLPVSVASQGDKLVIAGKSNSDFTVARYTFDGSVDTSFSDDGMQTTDLGSDFSESAQVVSILGDKIIVTGFSNTALAIVRYNADGSLDTSFSGDGKTTTLFSGSNFVRPKSAAFLGDKLLVAGYSYTYGVGGDFDLALARYNPDGTLDNTFSQDGVQTDYFPFSRTLFTSTVVQSDGKLIAVGKTYTNYAGYFGDAFIVVRYNTNGTLDTTFSQDGIQTTDFGTGSTSEASTVTLQGDKIVVAGYSYNANNANNYDVAVARYNADGTLDNTFSQDGKLLTDLGAISNDFAKAAISQGSKLIVAGYSYNFETGLGFTIIRYNADGSLDTTFSGDGIQTTTFGDGSSATANVLALQGDKLIVAGTTPNPNTGNVDFAVARYNLDGSPDNTFSEDGQLTTNFGVGATVLPQLIMIQGDRITIAGFSNDAGNLLLVRYNTDGSLDTSFSDDGKVTTPFPYTSANLTSAVKQEDGKIIIAGYSTSIDSFDQPIRIARYNPDGTPDPSFTSNTGINAIVYSLQALAIQGNRLYGVGYHDLSTYTGLGSGAFGEGVVAAYRLDEQVSLHVSCPASKTVATDQGVCSAVIQAIDPVVSPAGSQVLVNYTLSGATTGTGSGSVSGKSFATGSTTVTYTLAGTPTQTCSFTATVIDQVAPALTGVSASSTRLWPPNHKLVDITINYGLFDNCGANSVLSVSSNEPQSNTDKDDVAEDWQIIDAHHVKLRAERNGKGNGRVYTITITATDNSGNKTTQTVLVTVPHNNSGRIGTEDLVSLSNEDATEGLTVQVMPNPAPGEFTLRTQSTLANPLSVQVADPLGRIVHTQDNIPANGTLQLGRNYASGTYILTVVDGTQKVTVKLLKLAQ